MKTPFFNPLLTEIFAKMRAAPKYIANFDSATAMLRATAAYLREEDFPGIGTAPPIMEPLTALINKLPKRMRDIVYIQGSGSEAIPPEKLKDIRDEAVAEWMVSEYPQREYPAVAIGSASGALVHLCAALGIPWLPQTFMIPVQHPNLDPDEPKQDMEWGQQVAPDLLNFNPDLQLHHMHDPCQDRLTIQKLAYFRVKRLRLGAIYERFIEKNIPRGGTIFLVECQRVWPTTQLGERHIFQMGALGGATPEEFLHGSERVEAYLERYKSHVRRWDAPAPDGERPEAEWGFEPALRDDVERFARLRGYRVRRIVFQEPEHLSPFVAELYRWWYRQRKILSNRLVVESFILLEPLWALRTGSVPFWMKFNMEPSLEWIEQYLSSTDPYDEIYMMLFSHGADSIGLPPIERWRAVLNRARRRGEFIGVEEDKYPRDFAEFIRYYTKFKEIVPSRYPLPGSLRLEQLDQFIQLQGGRFPVRWIERPLSGEYLDEQPAALNVAAGSPPS